MVTLAAADGSGQSQFSKGSFDPVRIDVLTKEYPPEIYGGAGVHVAELVKALRRRSDVEARVHAFGGPRDEELTTSYPDLAALADANAALKKLGVDLSMVDGCACSSTRATA